MWEPVPGENCSSQCRAGLLMGDLAQKDIGTERQTQLWMLEERLRLCVATLKLSCCLQCLVTLYCVHCSVCVCVCVWGLF